MAPKVNITFRDNPDLSPGCGTVLVDKVKNGIIITTFSSDAEESKKARLAFVNAFGARAIEEVETIKVVRRGRGVV